MSELGQEMTDRGGTSIDWHGQRLVLLPDRAVLWPGQRIAFVADVHLGKVEAFHRGGIPVPAECGRSDLDRLAAIVERSGIETLVILGDLFHCRSGMVDEMLDSAIAWRKRIAGTRVLLVRGNHDARAGGWPAELAIEPVDEGTMLGPFDLRHHPVERPNSPVLCGHVHPAVVMGSRLGRGRSALRAPCYWIKPSQLMLPAFGRFTGCKKITPSRGDRVFAIGPGAVIETALAG